MIPNLESIVAASQRLEALAARWSVDVEATTQTETSLLALANAIRAVLA